MCRKFCAGAYFVMPDHSRQGSIGGIDHHQNDGAVGILETAHIQSICISGLGDPHCSPLHKFGKVADVIISGGIHQRLLLCVP